MIDLFEKDSFLFVKACAPSFCFCNVLAGFQKQFGFWQNNLPCIRTNVQTQTWFEMFCLCVCAQVQMLGCHLMSLLKDETHLFGCHLGAC